MDVVAVVSWQVLSGAYKGRVESGETETGAGGSHVRLRGERLCTEQKQST